ncbi:TerD family protein, partial [Thiococcus pfennigii]|uniref:TerD family protein n=1 Tax=Thiococcus pfennigii TaxID=1057 RepID=UPI003B84A36B
ATPPPSAAPKPTPSLVNLEKITLEKRAPISLEKRAQGFGELVINLNWNQRVAPAKGFFAKLAGPSSIDLDLGCLFKLRNGPAGAVQALGNAFGSLQQPPYIQLMGDDRTGANTEGEFLHINGRQWEAIEKVLVYAFIYQGVPNWSATDAVVTIRTPDQPTLEIRLDSHRNDQNMCALVLLENDRGNIKVTKQVEYFRDHAVMDRAYGFGLRWVAGRKD